MLTTNAAHKKDLRSKPATMTHQHFRVIAEIIRSFEGPTYLYDNEATRKRIAETFANGLASTNPNFDRARFLAAALHTEG